MGVIPLDVADMCYVLANYVEDKRVAFLTWLGMVRDPVTYLQTQQHPMRVLNLVADGDQEGYGLPAVDETMVVRQGKVHHWAGNNLSRAGVDDSTHFGAMHPQDCGLWGEQNWRAHQRTEDPSVGNGECPSLPVY